MLKHNEAPSNSRADLRGYVTAYPLLTEDGEHAVSVQPSIELLELRKVSQESRNNESRSVQVSTQSAESLSSAASQNSTAKDALNNESDSHDFGNHSIDLADDKYSVGPFDREEDSVDDDDFKPSKNRKSFEESFKLSRVISQLSMIGFPNEEEESQRLAALQSAISLQAEAARQRRLEFKRRQGEITQRRMMLLQKQLKNRNARLGISLNEESNSTLVVTAPSTQLYNGEKRLP